MRPASTRRTSSGTRGPSRRRWRSSWSWATSRPPTPTTRRRWRAWSASGTTRWPASTCRGATTSRPWRRSKRPWPGTPTSRATASSWRRATAVSGGWPRRRPWPSGWRRPSTGRSRCSACSGRSSRSRRAGRRRLTESFARWPTWRRPTSRRCFRSGRSTSTCGRSRRPRRSSTARWAVDVDSARAHHGRALTLVGRGRYRDAVDADLDAVSRLYFYPDAHFYLGLSFTALGLDRPGGGGVPDVPQPVAGLPERAPVAGARLPRLPPTAARRPRPR